MNWDDLRVFLAVARAGSLAGAARRLSVNHSTAYRRLNGLEQQLGVRLFDRHADGYSLTRAGADILDQAGQIEDAFDAIERRLRGRDFALSGHVRLTTAPNLAHAYLPGMLDDFQRAYPQVRVEISVSDTDYDLRRREADLALRATRAPPDLLIGREVARLPWSACVSPAYVERHGRPRDEDDLARHRLIGADDRFARLTLFTWLRQRFPDHAIALTCNDLTTMAAFAEQGLGVAFLPADLTRPHLERLFPVCPEATGQLWLLTHPDLRRVLRVQALMRFLFDRLRQDPRLAAHAIAPNDPVPE